MPSYEYMAKYISDVNINASTSVMVADMNVTTLRPAVNLVNLPTVLSVQCKTRNRFEEGDYNLTQKRKLI
jgi:hypothetical protein